MDEQGKLGIYEFVDKKRKKLKARAVEYVSNAILECCTIEPREGRLCALGGVDTKIYVYRINSEGKKGEKVNYMSKLVEMSGHSGGVSGV